jgi:hypothetical protein
MDELYEDEPEPIFCPWCENRGYRVLLGPKILMPNEPRPQDYEDWLQCPTCYELIPIYEMPKEETIKDSIETIDNPFESGKFQLQTIPKRNTPAGKKAYAKPRSKKFKLDPDPEIAELLRIYGDNVKVHQ